MRHLSSRPVLVAFALVLLAGVGWFVTSGSGAPPGSGDGAARGGPSGGGGGRGGGPREALVVTRTVEEGVTGDRLLALGDGEALASVAAVPRDGGVVEAVSVVSGARVSAGDALVRLDAEAETIARDLAARAVEEAESSRERQAALRRSRAGSQADLDAADNTLARARLELRDAALRLARRTVRAPIGGSVGIVEVEVGDRVAAESAIATIDDRSTLRVDFRVPERFAGRIELGQAIEATSFARPGRALAGEVSAIGGRVERDSRTLPVQALIDNADDALRPGMSFEIALRFPGETLPAVAPLAIQWDSTGAFVWKVEEGRAVRVPVRIVQRNPEAVLVAAELAAGDEVVVEGVLSLRDGAAVRIAGAPRASGDGGGARGGAVRRDGGSPEDGAGTSDGGAGT